MNTFLKKWHAPGYGDTPHQMTIIASPKNGEETRTIGWGPHQRLNKPPTHPVWVSSPSPGESDIPRKSEYILSIFSIIFPKNYMIFIKYKYKKSDNVNLNIVLL